MSIPCVLTILGLIIYVHFGRIVRNVGLGWTLAIAVLSGSIIFITGLGASEMAININVGVWGNIF